MEFQQYKLISTIILIIVAIFIRLLIVKSLKKIQLKFGFQRSRIIVTNKVVSLLISLTLIIVLTIIWGVEKKELFLFISSFLTIIGIGFFAQWSILSNITAGLILYFNYPVKIGDRITTIEKDFNITGKIIDIDAFFITLKTPEGKMMTIPNGFILQKTVQFFPDEDPEKMYEI